MKPRWCVMYRAALIGALAFVPAAAQESEGQDPLAWDEFTVHPDTPAVRENTVTIGGQEVRYLSAATTLTLHERGKSEYEPKARMFSITYLRLPDGETIGDTPSEHWHDVARGFGDQWNEQRPVTFIFNGGPGSSSVWLHLGLFGPRCVSYADELGNAGPPPYNVVENELSLLDVSDLVFIDPVSSGYSRTVGETSAKRYHGLETDIASVGAFIHRWLTETGRWGSPIYIAGESYGTTRAAGLARHLHAEHGIPVAGVALISAVLDFETIRGASDLPYLVFFPSLAATAAYHERAGGPFEGMTPTEVYEAAEWFARNELLAGIFNGAQAPEQFQSILSERMAEYTGIEASQIADRHLELGPTFFRKELLRDQGLVVGRFDSRYTGDEPLRSGERPRHDPSYDAIHANYNVSFNRYVRDQLGYESDLNYEIVANVWPWDFGGADDGRQVDVSDRLADVLNRSPFTRVFVASGIYDLATPPMGTDYTFWQMKLSDDARERVQVEYYEAGHMMYVHRPSFEKLSRELRAWYRAGTP